MSSYLWRIYHTPNTIVSTHIRQQPCKAGAVVISLLQTRSSFWGPCQGPTAGVWQSWDLDPSSLALGPCIAHHAVPPFNVLKALTIEDLAVLLGCHAV